MHVPVAQDRHRRHGLGSSGVSGGGDLVWPLATPRQSQEAVNGVFRTT